jgi:3-oxoacyl-(acyl-carrier-protein) synthase
LNGYQNNEPLTAVRPWDKNRLGAVQADGGAILVLESERSVLKRNAPVIAEIKGYHSCSVADHIYKPSKLGIQKVLGSVICQAGWHPSQIDLINGHATATLIGDPVESN